VATALQLASHPSIAVFRASKDSTMLKVLIVDDDKDGVELMALLVKSKGYAVRTAGDGQTAIDAAIDFKPQRSSKDTGRPLPGSSERGQAQTASVLQANRLSTPREK